MKKIKTSNLEIKKSKFISILYEIESIEDVNSIIDELKKEHKKARHIVYAYKINNQEKNFSDKEPSGTTRGLIDLIHVKDSYLHKYHHEFYIFFWYLLLLDTLEVFYLALVD